VGHLPPPAAVGGSVWDPCSKSTPLSGLYLLWVWLHGWSMKEVEQARRELVHLEDQIERGLELSRTKEAQASGRMLELCGVVGRLMEDKRRALETLREYEVEI